MLYLFDSVFRVQSVAVWVLPDNGGHDLCSEEDAEGSGGLGGEETQHWENCDGRLTEIWRGGEREEEEEWQSVIMDYLDEVQLLFFFYFLMIHPDALLIWTDTQSVNLIFSLKLCHTCFNSRQRQQCVAPQRRSVLLPPQPLMYD